MIDNFNYLVEQCKKRKRRYLLTLLIRALLGITLIAGAVVAYYLSMHQTDEQIPLSKISKPIPVAHTVVETNSTNTSAAMVTTAVVVKPVIVKPTAPAVSTPAAVSIPAAPPAAAPKTSLLEVSSMATTVESLIATYHKSPNYETALMIARDYYSQKNYEQSAIWAKKANVLNREAEEAWILYAKSYYAQGRKNEAIGVLELYLNYKESKTANELIKLWKTNP